MTDRLFHDLHNLEIDFLHLFMGKGDRVAHGLFVVVVMFIRVVMMFMAAFSCVDVAFVFVMMFVRFVMRTGQKSKYY